MLGAALVGAGVGRPELGGGTALVGTGVGGAVLVGSGVGRPILDGGTVLVGGGVGAPSPAPLFIEPWLAFLSRQ